MMRGYAGQDTQHKEKPALHGVSHVLPHTVADIAAYFNLYLLLHVRPPAPESVYYMWAMTYLRVVHYTIPAPRTVIGSSKQAIFAE